MSFELYSNINLPNGRNPIRDDTLQEDIKNQQIEHLLDSDHLSLVPELMIQGNEHVVILNKIIQKLKSDRELLKVRINEGYLAFNQIKQDQKKIEKHIGDIQNSLQDLKDQKPSLERFAGILKTENQIKLLHPQVQKLVEESELIARSIEGLEDDLARLILKIDTEEKLKDPEFDQFQQN